MTDVPARIAIVNTATAAITAVESTMEFQTDANVGFVPTDGVPWTRFTFLDGEQSQASFGAPGGRLFRGPALVFIDVFTPQGVGDALAVNSCKAAREALRTISVNGLRFTRFQPGPEGPVDGWYRKQLIAVLSFSERG